MLDAEMTEFLNGVVGVVEANSYERLCLWKEYTEELKKRWKDNRSGFSEVIGYLADMPVCISLFTSEVDGHKILFIDATSQVIDHRMIDKWLIETMPKSAFKDDGRFVNKTDAMNFHNIFHHTCNVATQ